MASITLANLRTRVLERANMVGSSFVSTAELNAIINGEGAELHDIVVGAYEDQFTTSLQFTISSGNTYSLTSSFYKLRGLDIQEGGDWFPLQRYEWHNRNRRTANSYHHAKEIRYRLVGSTLTLTPEDSALGTYRLWYIPGYTDLSADSDELAYPQNWHEFVIAGAAAKCLAKEESDPSVQLGLKEAAKQRIISMAANRDAGGPERIERVRNRYADEEEW